MVLSFCSGTIAFVRADDYAIQVAKHPLQQPKIRVLPSTLGDFQADSIRGSREDQNGDAHVNRSAE
jgi:hypothetical protein